MKLIKLFLIAVILFINITLPAFGKVSAIAQDETILKDWKITYNKDINIQNCSYEYLDTFIAYKITRFKNEKQAKLGFVFTVKVLKNKYPKIVWEEMKTYLRGTFTTKGSTLFIFLTPQKNYTIFTAQAWKVVPSSEIQDATFIDCTKQMDKEK